MRTKILVAGALALAPLAAPASALAQPIVPRRYPPALAAYTEVRVSPPSGGTVYVYDGHRLLGRFDRPGSVLVPTGRAYRVIALRGDAQIWAGEITAAGSPLDLDWSGGAARTREPNTPSGYPPSEITPRYGEPPAYAAPPIAPGELRALLEELDRSADDHDRLDALAAVSPRSTFTSRQAAMILARFRSDAYRMAALDRLRDRLGDDDPAALITRFRSLAMQRAARELLGD